MLRAEALMVVPSGSQWCQQSTSYAGAPKLCGPVPKYEFRVEGEIFKMKGGNEDGIMTNRLIRH